MSEVRSPASSLFELALVCSQEIVEVVSDALMDLGAQSVSVEDADAGTTDEHLLFGEPGLPDASSGWPRSQLRALFASEHAANAAAAGLGIPEWPAELRIGAVTPMVEQDWVRLTQSQFTPIEVAPAFWIVPSWHEPPAQASRVMRLDPGLAFGTGTHPTTRMCLRWIARMAADRSPLWTRVLDYGCGSGVLAIGAALYGARGVEAVDIDPAAVTATQANARANGVDVSAALPQAAVGTYALVLANILARPLEWLAPLLAGHVATDGHLVLAGILERQADDLRRAYAPWCRLEIDDRDEGWILMTARRQAGIITP